MQLSDITKLDQKNRTHIPSTYLHLIGIKDNAYVQVMVDTERKRIEIIPIDDDEQKILEHIKENTK